MSDLLPSLEIEGPPVPRYLVHMSPLHLPSVTVEVLVVGGGVAGLSAAVASAEQKQTLMLLKGSRGQTTTHWAQGGMAAVLGDDDSAAQHGRDTLRVAGGLAHAEVVREIVSDGPAVVDRWMNWGGRFDRDSAEQLKLAMEGGHSVPRIIHAQGDQTGAEIQRLLIARAGSMKRLEVHEKTFVLDLVTHGSAVRGVIAWSHAQGYHVIWAGSTILASGGVGSVYRESSNPKSATGDGHALAYRAGARMRGMEFVQFHPTVLYVAGMARFLVSETARGEGGKLVDRTGERFMPAYHEDAELAPRDVVSRAIVQQLGKVRDSNVYLDMRHLSVDHLKARFPVIYRACGEFGIDMATDLIPVHPACHYMVGGVETDASGRTNLEDFYACGEVGSTGFHGANRMGSNSLLEGAVVGHRAGVAAAESLSSPRMATDDEPHPVRTHSASLDLHDLDNALQSTMWRLVGIEREGSSLGVASRRVETWLELVSQRVLGDSFGWSLTNKLLVSALIARAAAARTESRGTHYRRDFPETEDAEWRRDLVICRGEGT
ncbi:MAG: L-aspartate oxidase [Planctomycetota bacterium]|nr:L-aspartate oxidase [Planctomycetota bacterium]